MFTGIVEKQAKIIERQDSKDLTLIFALPVGVELKVGASVLLNGICSTITTLSNSRFTVVYMPETRKRTTVDLWRVGDLVHCELSLRVGDPIDGHFVFGHIDTVASVSKVQSVKDGYSISFTVDARWMLFIVPKGSVTIDGVGLTVVNVGARSFSVSLIPYTLQETHLGELRKGDKVNIEVDMLAKYAQKSLGKENPKQ